MRKLYKSGRFDVKSTYWKKHWHTQSRSRYSPIKDLHMFFDICRCGAIGVQWSGKLMFVLQTLFISSYLAEPRQGRGWGWGCEGSPGNYNGLSFTFPASQFCQTSLSLSMNVLHHSEHGVRPSCVKSARCEEVINTVGLGSAGRQSVPTLLQHGTTSQLDIKP